MPYFINEPSVVSEKRVEQPFTFSPVVGFFDRLLWHTVLYRHRPFFLKKKNTLSVIIMQENNPIAHIDSHLALNQEI